MSSEARKATLWGIVVTLLLGGLILVGSRNLAHFDAALVAYTASILFATFGVTYRYAMWLSRPPTRRYWRRGWQSFLRPGRALQNIRRSLGRIALDVFANRFIFRRGVMRGIAHLLIMWGCILAVLITFPLVFGWLYFQPAPGAELELYDLIVFGFPVYTFDPDSFLAFFLFHGLVWASFLVIAGVMLAMKRRMQSPGEAATQSYAFDLLPLALLFAVSLTGLMLAASYTWLEGYAFEFIAIIHAVTVIGVFLWLPFGKLFHVFQRPAQLGVSFYKDDGSRGPAARCRRCGHAFSSEMHAADLIQVEGELGYRYETGEERIEHYQRICPPCRRALVALGQGRLRPIAGASPRSAVMPLYANPGHGEGPLGSEDEDNFHP